MRVVKDTVLGTQHNLLTKQKERKKLKGSFPPNLRRINRSTKSTMSCQKSSVKGSELFLDKNLKALGSSILNMNRRKVNTKSKGQLTESIKLCKTFQGTEIGDGAVVQENLALIAPTRDVTTGGNTCLFSTLLLITCHWIQCGL